jgi:GDP-L-fucose synthase
MMDLKNKKILLTGGGGFFGKHLFKKLISRGVSESNIFMPGSVEFDLRERGNCERAVKGRDIVIHVAGVTGNVEFHASHPAKIFYDNIMMGVELMETARRAGVTKFVTIGSATEYPEHSPLPLAEENLWIGPVELLHAPYTIAKKMLLVQAQAYRKQYGFSAIHLLMTSMYGPGEKIDGGPIPSLIERIAKAQASGSNAIQVWGTGKPQRDFLYIEDAAEAVLLATEKYDKPEPLNIGSGHEISIRELVTIIAQLMNFSGNVAFDTSRPDGQMRRFLDTARTEKEIGFKSITDFEAGLKATIKAHGY